MRLKRCNNMKKLLAILLCFLLCACNSQERNDYYVISFDNYTIAVGYDNLEYLSIIFDFDYKDNLEGYEEINDIPIKFLGNYFGKVSFKNNNKKPKEASEATLTSMTFYLKDSNASSFKINDQKLDSSIIKNCETFNGELIERNGYACVIEQEVNGIDNAIIMYGDISNIVQDSLDRIEIIAK